MKFGSICSGIEAASAAWHPLGWQCQFVSEIEPFPCSVLKYHYSNVPNYGDMTKHYEWPTQFIDVLVGGTPCQAFGVAGLRRGLADPRGNLTLTFLAVVEQYRPRWVVWENVPGVLSDKTGAFGAFLGGLGQLGYGFAYRILDAQYFGVAQRRRRVFVVAHSGGQWQRAAAVLFERESLCGDSAPRREAGQRTSGTISARTQGGGGLGTDFDCDGGCIAFEPGIASRNGGHCYSGISGTIRKEPGDNQTSVTVSIVSNGDAHSGFRDENGGGLTGKTHTQDELSRCLNAGAMGRQDYETETLIPEGGFFNDETKPTQSTFAVRRLTVTECEFLQGFPRNYTLVPHRGKPAADGPRYKALGNSMAVPVMRWIGKRIEFVESLTQKDKSAP